MDFIKKNGAGLLLCLCIAIPAWLLGQAVPVVGGPVFSILIGMVLTLFWKNKTKVQPGIGFTSKKVPIENRDGNTNVRFNQKETLERIFKRCSSKSKIFGRTKVAIASVKA